MSNLNISELKRQLEVMVRIGKMTQQQADARIKQLSGQTPQRRANANPNRAASNNHRKPKRTAFQGNLSAPYRFVELSDKIAQPIGGKAMDISKPIVNGFCAVIDTTWLVESPLLIGANAGGPNQTEPIKMGKDYIIPGSSLKGMTRAALEIIAFARLSPFNDHKYGLRDFDHPAYSSDEENQSTYPLSKVNEVRAGWLKIGKDENDKKVYTLTPCKWAQIEIDPLLRSSVLRGAHCRDRQTWVGFKLFRKYSGSGMDAGRTINFEKQFSFSKINPINTKTSMKAADNGSIKGTPVFSGQAPGRYSKKKLEYVFYDAADNSNSFNLTDQEFDEFERVHSKPGKKGLDPDGSWKDLEPTLKAGKRIPVFYVGDPKYSRNNDPKAFAMGLTRLFKVPHRFSVGDVAARTNSAHRSEIKASSRHNVKCDFVENLFGFVLEDDQFTDFDAANSDKKKKPKSLSLKGRIAFSFGRFERQPQLSQQVQTIMMGPRASFAPFYLKGPYKDYSVDEDATKLSGRKRYLPRYSTPNFEKPLNALNDQVRKAPPAIQRNPSIQTKLKFLVPATGTELHFSNTIKMHNVHAEEIGALLWVLTHGGDETNTYRHMLGRAKAFGAGQIRLDKLVLKITPNKLGTQTPDQAACLNAFENHMKKQVGNDWCNSKPIKEFLSLCDPNTADYLDEKNLLQYITQVREFAEIRKMTKPMKNKSEPLDGDKSNGDKWGGRYLETPIK